MFVKRTSFNANAVLKFQFLIVFLIAESFQRGIPEIHESIAQFISGNINNTSNVSDFAPDEFPKIIPSQGPPMIHLNHLINHSYDNVIHTINKAINNMRDEKLPFVKTVINNHSSNDPKSVNMVELYTKNISQNVYLCEHTNASFNSTTLIIASFTLVSFAVYCGLILWRKHLEKIYGSRELLVECDDIKK